MGSETVTIQNPIFCWSTGNKEFEVEKTSKIALFNQLKKIKNGDLVLLKVKHKETNRILDNFWEFQVLIKDNEFIFEGKDYLKLGVRSDHGENLSGIVRDFLAILTHQDVQGGSVEGEELSSEQEQIISKQEQLRSDELVKTATENEHHKCSSGLREPVIKLGSPSEVGSESGNSKRDGVDVEKNPMVTNKELVEEEEDCPIFIPDLSEIEIEPPTSGKENLTSVTPSTPLSDARELEPHESIEQSKAREEIHSLRAEKPLNSITSETLCADLSEEVMIQQGKAVFESWKTHPQAKLIIVDDTAYLTFDEVQSMQPGALVSWLMSRTALKAQDIALRLGIATQFASVNVETGADAELLRKDLRLFPKEQAQIFVDSFFQLLKTLERNKVADVQEADFQVSYNNWRYRPDIGLAEVESIALWPPTEGACGNAGENKLTRLKGAVPALGVYTRIIAGLMSCWSLREDALRDINDPSLKEVYLKTLTLARLYYHYRAYASGLPDVSQWQSEIDAALNKGVRLTELPRYQELKTLVVLYEFCKAFHQHAMLPSIPEMVMSKAALRAEVLQEAEILQSEHIDSETERLIEESRLILDIGSAKKILSWREEKEARIPFTRLMDNGLPGASHLGEIFDLSHREPVSFALYAFYLYITETEESGIDQLYSVLPPRQVLALTSLLTDKTVSRKALYELLFNRTDNATQWKLHACHEASRFAEELTKKNITVEDLKLWLTATGNQQYLMSDSVEGYTQCWLYFLARTSSKSNPALSLLEKSNLPQKAWLDLHVFKGVSPEKGGLESLNVELPDGSLGEFEVVHPFAVAYDYHYHDGQTVSASANCDLCKSSIFSVNYSAHTFEITKPGYIAHNKEYDFDACADCVRSTQKQGARIKVKVPQKALDLMPRPLASSSQFGGSPLSPGQMWHISKLSLQLLKSAVKPDTPQSERNTAVCTQSLLFLLALLCIGDEGELKESIQKLLGLKQEELGALVEFYSAESRGKSKYRNTNFLLLREGFELNQEYLTKVGRHGLDMTSFNGDFDQNIVDKVNSNCSKFTEGLIEQAISLETLKEIDIAIVNVNFFDGIWEKKFKEESFPRHYQNLKGEIQSVKMMGKVGAHLSYKSYNHWQAMYIPCDGGYAMLVALPPQQGISPIVQLNDDVLLNLSSESGYFRDKDNELTLPKFDFNEATNLTPAVIECGVSELGSDFVSLSNVCSEAIRGAAITQLTAVKVDEERIKTAAVTSLIGVMGLGPPSYGKRLVLDRPFLFCTLNENGAILTIGQHVSLT